MFFLLPIDNSHYHVALKHRLHFAVTLRKITGGLKFKEGTVDAREDIRPNRPALTETQLWIQRKRLSVIMVLKILSIKRWPDVRCGTYYTEHSLLTIRSWQAIGCCNYYIEHSLLTMSCWLDLDCFNHCIEQSSLAINSWFDIDCCNHYIEHSLLTNSSWLVIWLLKLLTWTVTTDN